MEQAIIARRVATLGAGVVVGGQAPFGVVTAAALRAAVTRILPSDKTAHNPYQQAAQRIGESLKAAGGPQRAADEIQAFLERKQAGGTR